MDRINIRLVWQGSDESPSVARPSDDRETVYTPTGSQAVDPAPLNDVSASFRAPLLTTHYGSRKEKTKPELLSHLNTRVFDEVSVSTPKGLK